MEIPKMVRQNEVVHRSELRRWGKGLGLRRKGKLIPRMVKKSKCLVNKCLLGCTETLGHREEF